MVKLHSHVPSNYNVHCISSFFLNPFSCFHLLTCFLKVILLEFSIYRVKHRLHEMLHSNDDFKEEDFARVCRNLILNSAIFSWVSKVTCDCFVLALLRFVIGSENSRLSR